MTRGHAIGAARRCGGHRCADCGAQYRHAVCQKRPSCPICAKRTGRQKYGARRTEYAGETYDSAAEAAYAARLDAEMRAGLIRGWERWREPIVLIDGPTRRERVTYKPDFAVTDGGETWAVDVKGFVTREFRLKALLWAERCADLACELRVVDRNGSVIATYGGRRAA